jgi:hypothetical protein
MKLKNYVMVFMVLSLVSIPCVMAGTGSLKISPEWPTMVASPADFTVWCQNGISYDVNILLVMTDSCHASLPSTDGVVVEDDVGTPIVSFGYGDFTGVTGMGGVYVPDSGTTPGARYVVSSLKDHLDLGLSEPLESDDKIWWAMKPLFATLDNDPEAITIKLNSDNPRMLIYLMGKSEDSADLFDMHIPPTPAGFIIPEVAIGSIMAVAAMFTALGLFAYKKKHKPTK